MTAFEKIAEMKETLANEYKSNGIKATQTITMYEHYQRMLNMLSVLNEELKNAEYCYEVVYKDDKVEAFDDVTVLVHEIGENLLCFQPVITDSGSIYDVDMESLCNTLSTLKEAGEIKEDIMIIPPNVNMIRVRLVTSSIQSSDKDDDVDRYVEHIMAKQEIQNNNGIMDVKVNTPDDTNMYPF